MHFCIAGVCKPTVISIVGWPKLSFLQRSTNGKVLSNTMSVMVLVQKLAFHKGEFKLVQSLPLIPATAYSKVTFHLLNAIQICVEPDHMHMVFLEQSL